jgi:DNA-binding MurR/RpiR family transcriptional regulator
MPATMAKIAAVLIDDPRAPLNLSITELAERAGTSPASVTRFCRMIGYSGYSPLRVGIAEDVGRGGAQAAWLADIGRSFGPHDPPEDIKRALLDTHVSSLQTTAALLDLPTAVRVADDVLIAASPDGYLQPADLSARHCQLFVVDFLYLLIAQSNFDRTTRYLAASAAAVAPRRRPMRGAAIPNLAARRAVQVS